LTPTDIVLNLVGKFPAVGDKLILDVSTIAVTAIPEPMSLAMLGVRLLGMVAAGAARGRGTEC
jgi:hypothetical protein